MLSLAVLALIVFALLPILAFSFECLSALLPGAGGASSRSSPRPRCTVLIPACNEEHEIAGALGSLRAQLREEDRVLVVADNCTDATASVARAQGATVIERREPLAIGKDRALEFGIEHLRAEPPDVVLVLDADTIMEAGALDRLVGMAAETCRPVQGAYRLEPPAPSSPADMVSFLAVTVKNLVRPMGLERAGLPCPLTGSGFAIPWSLIQHVPVATGEVVEDVRMGIDLAIAGYPPRFCAEAGIVGRLHADRASAGIQRRRWEHGQIANLVRQVPRLLGAGLRQRRVELLAMAIDVAIPPLALLILVWLFVCGLAVIVGLRSGEWTAAWLGAGGSTLLLGTVLAIRARFLAEKIPLRVLGLIPNYMISKIPLYLAVAFRRQRQWETQAPPRADAHPDADVILAGIHFWSCTERKCVERVLDELALGHGGWIITMNVDHLRRCRQEPKYAELATRASFIVADGTPLIWASRIQGTPLPERVAGSRLIHSLCAGAAREKRSVLLLGGAPNAAETAAHVLRTRHPELTIAGTSKPDIGFESRPDEIERVAEIVMNTVPDIVFVGLGSPKQEHLIDRLRDRHPSTWWIGIGVTFSFVAGLIPEAPRWMQDMGLEWTHRLACEPRRLAHRYLVQDLPFALKMMAGVAYRRVARERLTVDRDPRSGGAFATRGGSSAAQSEHRRRTP